MFRNLIDPCRHIGIRGGLNRDGLAFLNTDDIYESKEILPDSGKLVPVLHDLTKITILSEFL
jgi:hypothetical protein